MVDLVRDGRIWKSPLPLWLKGAYAMSRRGLHGLDTLAALGERLCAEGYEWSTLSGCYERLVGRGLAAVPVTRPREAGGDETEGLPGCATPPCIDGPGGRRRRQA